MTTFGADRSSALILGSGEAIYGATRAELLDIAASAVLLVNTSGHLKLDWLMERLRRKVYVDDDPGFTQFWLEAGHKESVARHDLHFTIAENIGSPECSIPMGGIRWHSLREFVILDQWPVARGARADRFTTVAAWRGPYGPVTHDGRTFGLKAHEFRKFIDLPARAPQTFEIALDIHPADDRDREALERHGWRLIDPKTAISNPLQFREYVQGSGGECSVAKGLYVDTNSGWFSDRTVCYLASGKPALVQDTGFSRRYPSGLGLVSFTTMDQAVEGARSIERSYDAHCRAAREIAETYFDSDKALADFIDTAGVAP
jgi:hypothetical protein